MQEATAEDREREREARHYLRYAFFKAAREWRSLDRAAKEKAKSEFVGVLERHSGRVSMRFYSLVGTRGDVDFMIWMVARDLGEIQTLTSELLSTELGRQLDLAYSFLAMSKRSTYLGSHRHEGQEGATTEKVQGDSKYVFVYPLVKKREWYKVPFAERQRIMGEHFRIGHRYPKIKINTGYSFGLDDQEFVLAFEGDSPAEFLDLVEELRTSDASKYTERETPIFTCVAVDPKRMIELIG